MQKKENYAISKSPYDNIECYHPDGSLMCYLSSRQADWYIKKQLGTFFKDENEDKTEGNKKLKLNFIPNGKGEPEVLLRERKNICVVSGKSDMLTKHHVIPYQYRKCFPSMYKNRNHFDLVLLQDKIHHKYEKFADVLKMELYKDFVGGDIIQFQSDFTTAHKLLGKKKYYYDKLSPEKQVYLDMKFEGLKERWNLKDSDFENFDPVRSVSYTQKIIDGVGGPENLIVLWKRHFVKYAKPKFLPEWWHPDLIKIHDRNLDHTQIQRMRIVNIEETPKLKEILMKYSCYEI